MVEIAPDPPNHSLYNILGFFKDYHFLTTWGFFFNRWQDVYIRFISSNQNYERFFVRIKRNGYLTQIRQVFFNFRIQSLDLINVHNGLCFFLDNRISIRIYSLVLFLYICMLGSVEKGLLGVDALSNFVGFVLYICQQQNHVNNNGGEQGRSANVIS